MQIAVDCRLIEVIYIKYHLGPADRTRMATAA